MGSLTEFLKERAQKERAEHGDRKQIREDWVRAVDRLTNQIEQWLRNADPDQVLEIEPHGVERREELTGYYLVQGLRVRLGAREARVVPVSRFVVPGPPFTGELRPHGRVDITNGESSYSLLRVLDRPGGRWMLSDERRGLRDFDQAEFEAIMQDLLA